MKLIDLGNGMFTKVDDADYEWLNQWKWIAHRPKGNKTWYARRTKRLSKTKTETIAMHRLICGTYGRDVLVDHKDHDTLNNQRGNLRICTVAENSRNRMPKLFNNKNSKHFSKYVGVGKYGGSFKSQINGLYLGTCTDEIIAALARDEAAKEIYG